MPRDARPRRPARPWPNEKVWWSRGAWRTRGRGYSWDYVPRRNEWHRREKIARELTQLAMLREQNRLLEDQNRLLAGLPPLRRQ
jgi:hypothetical protein